MTKTKLGVTDHKLKSVQQERYKAWRTGDIEKVDQLTERLDALLDERLDLMGKEEAKAA